MTAWEAALAAFHFLRPLWLAALPAIALVWWIVRREAMRDAAPPEGLAPHLSAALTVGAGRGTRLRPIDGAALTLALLALGAAGPTWSRTPDPFAAQAAPVVVALRVAPSMEATDLAPSRLERARHKIRDLLDLRAGARTALVAYAGTAHAVVPLTEDAGLMRPYLEGLSPAVMPQDGNAAVDALALATEILAAEGTPGGAVLFVTDALDPADAAALTAEGAPTVAVLAMLPEGVRDRGVDALPPRAVAAVTPDASDLRRLDRALDAGWRRATLEDAERPWEDRGWWFAWPAALLALFQFRRGWTMRWAVLALAAGLGAAAPGAARADGPADWFLTPDQQGRLAYERRDFSRAGDLYLDPLRRGHALYRAGRYEEAVQALDRVETAEAAFIQGMAHLKSRGYRDGVRAFEAALARDPDFPGAAENLATAREIVDYVERVREQSDTGEDTGIGADDTVLDNEAGRGAETDMAAPSDAAGDAPLTAEQWMSTVDTDAADFLRQRFALEAARRDRAPEPGAGSEAPAPGAEAEAPKPGAGSEAPE